MADIPVPNASPVSDPIELLTNVQMAEADRLTIAAGTPGITLMERAGAAVADAARQILSKSGGSRITILCGPGNNGGDGFVAARILKAMGYQVSTGLLGPRDKLAGDAAMAAGAWTGPAGSAALVDLDKTDLVIDALFGAGLSRAVEGRARSIIERVNLWRDQTGKPVLAVDVPSGLDGDTGAVRGACVRADYTVTFFRLKPGHILLPGRDLCGHITLADIGISAAVLEPIGPSICVNQPGLWRAVLPVPGLSGHKYSRGHALVVSGPAHQTGAARLAARGALRAGAGLVTMAAEGEAITINAAHLTAVMVAPYQGLQGLRSLLDDKRKNCVAIGPGAGTGEQTRQHVEAILAHPNAPACVLDADALTSFEGRADTLGSLIKGYQRTVILTPHEGEFRRLFNHSELYPDSVSQQPDSPSEGDDATHEAGQTPPRLTRASAAAKDTGAIVCLKGPDTIIASPDGRVSIMRDASPWLATAGSGDVLAGIMTGLLAQGMPGFEAASAAVWMHARAADVFGPGLIAEDLPEALPGVWRILLAS